MKEYYMLIVYFSEYLMQNWSLMLILSAFAIALHITVFLDKKTIRRLYILIIGVFCFQSPFLLSLNTPRLQSISSYEAF